MLVRVVDVPEERRPEDAEGEEEAEGEAEEDGGEDGVGDDHGVHVPAATLLLELAAIRRIVLESRRIRRKPSHNQFYPKLLGQPRQRQL